MTYGDLFPTLADGTTQTTTGAAVSVALNSLFAPRSGGHQPYGFDTLATIYRRYKVYSVKIEGTCMCKDATNTDVYAFTALRPGSAATTIGAQTLAATKIGERPLSRFFLLRQGTNRQAADFSMNVPIHSLEGLTKAECDANSDYRALMTASPAIVPTIEFANAGATSTSIPCEWRIRMTFDVEFYERANLAQS